MTLQIMWIVVRVNSGVATTLLGFIHQKKRNASG